MPRILFLLILLEAFDYSSSRIPRAEAGDDPVLLPARFSPPLPVEPKGDQVNIRYQGTVTEVTKTSITIQYPTIEWPGWDKPREFKPKEFAVSLTLELGQFPTSPRPELDGRVDMRRFQTSFCYRLSDVKVGDVVMIRYAHLGDLDICDAICITKRPGGRVPPLPEEAEKLRNPTERYKAKHGTDPPPGLYAPYIPYHERINAYHDLEDKGIPYPEKFGKDRRFPVAPMPREAKPPVPVDR